jgi:hypothetical protein
VTSHLRRKSGRLTFQTTSAEEDGLCLGFLSPLPVEDTLAHGGRLAGLVVWPADAGARSANMSRSMAFPRT